jgi:ribonucleoside-diphosphate reductase alpha chain
LTALGYSESQINNIVKYCIGHGTLKTCPFINHEQLRDKGLSQVIIDKIEKSLSSAYELKHAFSPFTIGKETLKVMGFTDEQISDFNLDVLKELGFTEEERLKAEEYVCGAMTLEGAPELKDEHLSVFDCASRCGKKGTRIISYEGHMKMMATVQPYLSGAISKTINMDSNATIEDVNNVYIEAWKMMIKAVALYRDGCKLSQPLSATNIDESELLALQNENDISDIGPKELHDHVLKNLKQGFVQECSVGGQKIIVSTKEFDDGSLAELDITVPGEDLSLNSTMNSFARSISVGIQNKIPLNTYVDEFAFTKGHPAGMVIGHDAIRMSSSLIDFVSRLLGFEYLNRIDLVHIKDVKRKKEDGNYISKTQDHSLNEEEIKRLKAKSQGYTGESCSNCGSMKMRRNGTCMLCEDCGTTTGCS